ncbi:hypothetical protein A2572_00800 [Candidatus Collierbacteria bacterium RIFOXYD1_FULL_40_9]|uniref:Uncharacterized protein n=1 Tax=Candidatus Collierbacteria bacterium RIFOXYD1_FULL_40_9 TaxID=1817731 RepID=A0A1F5FW23_9BACT|nr:MAG: hypothetical protein A2572_00800 [Candidatus Collierbacteria bacterium RIFOXYD1_FULL_40_9]
MAIQQHPVPQDISNYKFRLIGDMTIKQFAALGISIVLSVMTYSAPLPFFFKYPLSFILLLLGVGTAFVPFQGRTLDVWIVAFIKSIYSPTQYIWKHGHQEVVTAPISENATPQTPIVNISAPATDTTPVTNQSTNDSTLDSKETNVPLVKGGNEGDLIQTEPIIETNNQNQPIEQQPVIQEVLNTAQPVSETITIDNLSSKIPQPDISSLPIPFTPTTPNTLVGLTLTPQGQTLDGVLVEIKNQSITMRATKSNKLGQFLFVRPLENGLYQILAEKEGFKFESYSIQLTGEIINPLRIQAI